MDKVRQLVLGIPLGYSEVVYQDRPYSLTRKIHRIFRPKG